MGRTLREQWADDSLLITVHGSATIAATAIPLIAAEIAKMGEIGWIVCAAISSFAIIASGRYILSRSERKLERARISVTPQATRTTGGASIPLSERELIRAVGTGPVFIVHNGKRLWVTSGDLLFRIDPSKNSASVLDIPHLLLDRIPVGPDINTQDDITRYLGPR